ncbi:MAG TPA: potassium channel family protein [Vicinamibacteria bacterium]|nr:potassium channel family protein [Vicinamibacteria bacterium]
MDRKYDYLALLTSLLLLFILNAMTGLGYLLRLAVGLASTAVVFSALAFVWRRHYHRSFLGAIAFGGSFVLINAARTAWDTPLSLAMSDVLMMGFILILGYAILGEVLGSRTVTMNTVYGAACAYLLIGLLWAGFYRLVFWVDPGAFRMPESISGDPQALIDSLGYFSYVTLTTLGYGDIAPVNPIARALAVVEAVIGQLYVGILIARMVGLHIASAAPNRSNDG